MSPAPVVTCSLVNNGQLVAAVRDLGDWDGRVAGSAKVERLEGELTSSCHPSISPVEQQQQWRMHLY